MSLVVLLFAFISVSVALPTQDSEEPAVQNVITVPPNCSAGQELVNGQCRDIWTWRNNPNIANLGVFDPSLWFSNKNVITVPPNCPPGQQLINGVCRDVWRIFALTTALPKLQYSNLEQRDRRQADTEDNIVNMFDYVLPYQINRNIINIPNQCPVGYKPDAFGFCRQILK